MNASTAPVPQPRESPATTQATVNAPAYTFTPRVLDRWAKKNLQLKAEGEDGSSLVEFRFHGSTCGNIEFDLLYHVKVGSADVGWPILEQRCEPAPHGDGHTRMCCWRESSAMVKDWMSHDAPLTGGPLAAAITWNPAKSASGCLCHVDGRMHKWNAVLQTLHFALSKNADPL